MLCSFITNLIVAEVKYGECLKKIVNEWMNKKKIGVGCITLFCCKAFPRCCAPLAPISLLSRLSVINV